MGVVTLDELIVEIERLGIRFVVSAGDAKAYPPQDPRKRKRFEELIPCMTSLKQELLAHFQPPPMRVLCPLCGRDVTNEEDKERLAAVNPFCDRGEVPRSWKDGTPEIPGCPYRGTS